MRFRSLWEKAAIDAANMAIKANGIMTASSIFISARNSGWKTVNINLSSTYIAIFVAVPARKADTGEGAKV